MSALTLGLLLSGCASVTVPLPKLEREAPATLTERSALRQAVTAVAAATPPASEADGLRLVVFGGRDDARDAVAARYLDTLSPVGPAGGHAAAVMRDADEMLRRARAVAEAGRPGATTSEHEVRLLEEAIADVQHARRVYVAALRRLREEGAPLTKAEIRSVNDAFVQSCRDIGAAADMVTARLGEPAPTRVAETPNGGGEGY